MAHTNPDHWTKRPGNWNTLRTEPRLPSSTRYGFPDLLPCTWTPPRDLPLLAYTTRDDHGRALSHSICHFFLDDYRFESLWHRPLTALARVRRFRATLGPDFSLYRDWPLAAQVWNTYRARVVTRTWQDQGLTVVPVVNWGLPDTWEWCFDGIQRGGTIALSVPDLRDQATRALFFHGWQAMLDRLAPRLALIYGRLPFAPTEVRVKEYLPDWHRLRQHPPQTKGAAAGSCTLAHTRRAIWPSDSGDGD